MIKEKSIITLEKATYDVISFIAEGAYGRVWKARRRSDGETVALKEIQTKHQKTKRVYITELIRLTCSWVWASENDGSSSACFNFFNGKRGQTPFVWGNGRVLPVRVGK